VASGLAEGGDQVDVWAPQCNCPDELIEGVSIHRLPGHFGPRALATLDRGITAGRARILVQYVPHAFGLKAMNLPFCCWLYARRSLDITVMFHEVAFRRRVAQPLRHNLLGEITSLMATLVARSARRIFVPAQAWGTMLRALVGNLRAIEWLPVPSTIPLVNDPQATQAIRTTHAADGLLVGHFGTYGADVREYLEVALPEIFKDRRVSVILLGRGSGSFREALTRRRPNIAGRAHATDGLSALNLSAHLSACDLMLQPFPDGINARRTSAMAALLHGKPVVTTKGRLTEPLWYESGAVATVPADNPSALAPLAIKLLEDHLERQRLGQQAKRLYQERFDLCRTINALQATNAHSNSQLVQP
jgi:hypothetical protein